MCLSKGGESINKMNLDLKWKYRSRIISSNNKEIVSSKKGRLSYKASTDTDEIDSKYIKMIGEQSEPLVFGTGLKTRCRV
jgi:hypothetical protein